ncbi:hypothetical protein POTOM_038128 [Populus tomentosa]|uniref:Uncharacterized protein n=1 Tax=Populus tomentosa TaxID=118781 RepID=A0A8X7Z093_POPTO|nr:hypothetical protein POTOM_038128 [Populus tomentosa]
MVAETLCLDYCLSEHAEKYGFGVVEHFVGHGVGTGTINFTQSLVDDLFRNDGPGAMVEGETFTIGEFIFWSCLAIFDNSIL